MPVATQPTRNQLRKAKKKTAKQNEVSGMYSYSEGPPCSSIITQATSTPSPELPRGLEPVPTNFEPAAPIEQEPEDVPKGIFNTEEATPAHVIGNKYTMTSRLFVTATAYLLGLITLLVGVGILLNPTSFAKRIIHPYLQTTVARERASRAATPIAMMVGSQVTGIGLTILSLVYQKRLRSLGTVLLCTVVARVIARYVEWKSGFKSDALGAQSVDIVDIMLMAFVGASGTWMIRHG
ncbi:MAG: hypothetical protein ASARMPREDX12_005256 [Alectoria sarmentosa]|nr:MAG: hypothetical protein ASARMPREDX12_005256 [Alectoria sarmentosa]